MEARSRGAGRNGVTTIAGRGGSLFVRSHDEASKPPVIHGENGSQPEGRRAGPASHYISFTRLETNGVIVSRRKAVFRGRRELDGSRILHAPTRRQPKRMGLVQFTAGRGPKSCCSVAPHGRRHRSVSAGTFIDSQGHARHLAAGDFTLTPGKTWTSAATGGRYPIEWTIEVPSIAFKAAVRTPLVQQEITGRTNYWEGAIDVDATKLGSPVKGVGYLEMTGYAGPIVGLD